GHGVAGGRPGPVRLPHARRGRHLLPRPRVGLRPRHVAPADDRLRGPGRRAARHQRGPRGALPPQAPRPGRVRGRRARCPGLPQAARRAGAGRGSGLRARRRRVGPVAKAPARDAPASREAVQRAFLGALADGRLALQVAVDADDGDLAAVLRDAADAPRDAAQAGDEGGVVVLLEDVREDLLLDALHLALRLDGLVGELEVVAEDAGKTVLHDARGDVAHALDALHQGRLDLGAALQDVQHALGDVVGVVRDVLQVLADE